MGKHTRGYHAPLGSPCVLCGLTLLAHSVDHAFEGTGKLCGRLGCVLPPSKHAKPASAKVAASKPDNTVYIGIDGEGQGRADHRYVLLAASTEKGDREWTVEAPNSGITGGAGVYNRQLTTVECLDLILSLPTNNTKIFSFSFNYDRTKMLTDLPDKSIFELERPDLPHRQPTGKSAEFKGADPIVWTGPNGRVYYLNLQGTKFTVASYYPHPSGSGRRVKKTVTVWDLFKFFQGKFTGAIDDWQVGDEETRDFIRFMKERRDEFDKEPPERVRRYCLQETRYIAELARKLVEAHRSADLDLKSFHGAGSSGAAMLDVMGIRDKLAPTPEDMRVAVACAFGGGRFENSVIGTIREPLNNWDISSAYVYGLAFLPCLTHASWKHTTRREDIDGAQAQNGALVRYTLGDAPRFCLNLAGKEQDPTAWGPFPFRTEDGSISYPIESGGGWVWLDEYVIGEKLFPHVEFREAWVYESNCDCQPFKRISDYYLLRLRVGKEGRGKAIKLGLNSGYGKLAQSIGAARYNNWIWAGMITSKCRSQLLNILGMHDDFRNMLMLATDGVVTREKITPPAPLETGTDIEYMKKGKLVRTPLGGWEHKDCPRGMFIARPGIYFPLEPTEDEIEAIRARGVGRTVVLKSWPLLVAAWERDCEVCKGSGFGEGVDGKCERCNGSRHGKAKMPDVTRFCGAKTSISVSNGGKSYKRANGAYVIQPAPSPDFEGPMPMGFQDPNYGQWIARPVEMGFDPLPKRERINHDGRTLELRRFPKDLMTIPYKRAMRVKDEMGRWIQSDEPMSTDALMMQRAEQEALEQPDVGLEEYELDMQD